MTNSPTGPGKREMRHDADRWRDLQASNRSRRISSRSRRQSRGATVISPAIRARAPAAGRFDHSAMTTLAMPPGWPRTSWLRAQHPALPKPVRRPRACRRLPDDYRDADPQRDMDRALHQGMLTLAAGICSHLQLAPLGGTLPCAYFRSVPRTPCPPNCCIFNFNPRDDDIA